MADAPDQPDLPEAIDGETVTVEQLNDEIATALEEQITLRDRYVVGDVSDCNEANGHRYFDLCYEGATIDCALFAGYRRGGVTEPDDDSRVAIEGDLSYYEPRGSCTLIVRDVVHLGESAYSQVYEQNRKVLAADGLLDDERKQELPELPRTVGLVTSADSDARTDAITAIHSRYPSVDVIVAGATVQGPDALPELLGAIKDLDENPAVDVIVVTRGGGAETTLRVFDETPICRVIANTTTPVVVGIGHENDRTLAGEAADERVMTPTHAGEIVPERVQLEADFERAAKRLDAAYESAVADQLGGYAIALDNAFRGCVESTLREYETSLDRATERQVERRLDSFEHRLDRAYHDLQRKRKHEQQLTETVDSAREQARTRAYDEAIRRRRLYRIALVVLTVLVLLLLGFLLL